MKHIHKKTGLEFEVGYYVDTDNKLYDMTIISKFNDPEISTKPIELVDYYYGGYDCDTTDEYIDAWLASRSKEFKVLSTASELLDDYCTINSDVLLQETIDKYMSAKKIVDEMIEERNDCVLSQLKEFKKWFDSLMGPDADDESIDELYNTSISITVAGKTIDLSFDAENYNNIRTVLERAIEEF